MNTKKLAEYSLKFIKSSPVDIYNEETDEVEISTLQLKDSRFCQIIDRNSTYVGSGNLFLAVLMLSCKYHNILNISDLTLDKLNIVVDDIWPNIVEYLIEKNILVKISDKEDTSLSHLKLIVDNT